MNSSLDPRTTQRIESIREVNCCYKKVILPVSIISFQSEGVKSLKNQKQKVSLALKKLDLLMKQNFHQDILKISLINIVKCLEIFYHNQKHLNKFCSVFPYQVFFSIITTHNDPEIATCALKIFSLCCLSKHFPRNTFSKPEHINFLLNLFNQINVKYHDCIFRIFKECILRRPDVRNYLLQHDVLNFIDQNSPVSIEFISFCLASEPDIEKGYANTINVFLTIALRSNNKDVVLTALRMFKLKSFQNSKIIDPNLLSIIFNELFPMNDPAYIIPILNVASSIKLDRQTFIPMVMNSFGSTNNIKVFRKCIKLLQIHYEEWREFPEILTYLSKFLPSSYEKEKNIAQIMMLYLVISPEIDAKIVDFILRFASDRTIGLHCLAFTYHVLNSIISSENADAKQKILEVISNNIEQIETLAGDENEEIQKVAISILDLLPNI
ncbi:hypothetical protein TRFO_37102 [Tritrichomonas foetus]|uniref:Uncharacterized protein n=1 Tax=Tritrichomonas foetus TaxID=1144522 RepID=A0A1J4JGC7_9EUKA|nr:hypothetical protein TRFO_37102 [Tritrichomonas foetus]|eukprot:OHS96699.1 hypothetical protein TRFO_37102 [Tritrichomonas foetus]